MQLPQIMLLAVGAGVVLSNLVQGAEATAPVQVTSVEGITEYRFENGLRVLLFPDPSKPTVTVNLTVFVGSRHEGYGEAGMAHLLEHMLFKGTPTHPAIPKALQSRGANFNGTTWYDRTNYYETLPASDENLDFAIGLEADRMVNSFIKGSDLASEMSVVRNEFERGENQPTSVLFQKMMAAAYEWHNYGKSTIGNRADIERVPVESLRRFYKQHYQPDNALLVIAGAFTPAKALELVQKHFGKISKPARTLEPTYTEEPAQDGERTVTLQRVGNVSVVSLLYHIPSGGHPDFAAIDVLESILTAEPSGRLYKALVETRRASRVSGGAYALHDPGVLRLVAEVGQGNEPDAVLGPMQTVLDEVAKNGVSQAEVDRARQILLKDFELRAHESKDLAIDLSNWAAQGDWRLYFLYRDRLEKVSAADVHRVAAEYLKRNNCTVGIFTPVAKPERVEIPGLPDLAEMIGDYKGRELAAEGEAFEVSPANIDARTRRETLPGGLKVALLSKKTRGEAVSVQLTLRYGDERSLRGTVAAAKVLPELMTVGTKQFNRQQLEDALDKHRAELSAQGEPGEASFTILTKRSELPAVMELLRQMLREPTLPADELDVVKRQKTANLEKTLTDPISLARETVSRQLNPYDAADPRYIATAAEEMKAVQALSRDDLQKLYDGFLGADVGELVIVGDFDADTALAAASKMFKGWKSQQAYAPLVRIAEMKVKGNLQTIVTPDKPNAFYLAGLVFPMKDDNPDYAALVIGDYILGAGALSSRLGDRVRQKEGLSYGVRSALVVSAIEARARFSMYAICNPANMDKVKQAIAEELDLLLKKGTAADELDNAKRGYLKEQEVAFASDVKLSHILAENLHAGRSMKYYAGLERQIQSVTPEQVHAALVKYIDPKKLVIAVAGDFKRPTPDAKSAGPAAK